MNFHIFIVTPGTVMKLLNDLKWPPLEKRIKVARLKMMLKVVSGQSEVQIPSYITQKNDGLPDNSILVKQKSFSLVLYSSRIQFLANFLLAMLE